MLWDRNIRVLLLTASLSTGIGSLFLVINSIMMTGIWFPYLFLLSGSTLTLIILTLFHVTESKNETLRLVLCYAQMILVCVYAGILSTQTSNYNMPATSVIVFIAILPLTIDDRPIRMYIVMFCETASYLLVSFLLKSPQAFSLDMMNCVTFFIVSMVLYAIICTRNKKD